MFGRRRVPYGPSKAGHEAMVASIAAELEGTGVTAVSIDSGVPLAWAAETLRPHGVVQGNLDNLVLVAGGPVMESEVRRIVDAFTGGPFVFNLGHGILPETPPGHVGRLVDLVRNGTSP